MPSHLFVKKFRAQWIALAFWIAVPFLGIAQSPPVQRPADGPAYRDDRILIIPKAGRAAQLGRFHGQIGTRLRRAFPNLGNIHVIELPRGISAKDAVARYQHSGHVTTAELDIMFQADAMPNDPRLVNGDQWHLNNFGQGGGLSDADIDAPEAWNVQNSASNIIVAVIDTGIRLTHQDLAANLWTNPGEIAGNGVDDDGNGIVDDVHGINATNAVNNTGIPNDDSTVGHGTHVAGIIGAVGNNGLGGSGVAWRVKLMACKFLNQDGQGSLSGLLDCFDYAKAKGAKVVNCSFTVSPGDLLPQELTIFSTAISSLQSNGIVVVAAAGNSGANNDVSPNYPASFVMDNVISVAATTRTDGLWFASNFGATSVHLGAPGASILSTRNRNDADYDLLSGTSMATPCVAGAVALLRARFPSFTHQQIISRLLGTVDPIPALAGRCTTGGRLNLARALGTGDFTNQPIAFSWVATNGMTPLTLTDNGVSTALALPFPFSFYGRDRTAIFVGANGLIGFTNTGLGVSVNTDLGVVTAPNAMLCPFWDNLNPALGGRVWFGTDGVTPNRRAVVTWADVPQADTSGGQTRFTLQAILHEGGRIAFQYLNVATGNLSYVFGNSATIGVEDDTGSLVSRYSFNGFPASVTNGQAILFVPQGTPLTQPVLTPLPGQFQFRVTGQPAERCVVRASDDLVNWTNLATNNIPASGAFSFMDTNAGANPRRFYQAVLSP